MSSAEDFLSKILAELPAVQSVREINVDPDDLIYSGKLGDLANKPKFKNHKIRIGDFRGGKIDPYVSSKAVPRMGVYQALREFSQNLIDECVSNNGGDQPSFDGIRLASETIEHRGNAKDITLVYNEDHVLGEIVYCHSKDTLTFTNFGSFVPSIDHLLRNGLSSKRNRSNQIGQHGEGFMNAVTVLLRNGAQVNMIGIIQENGGFTAQKLVFSLEGDNVMVRRRKLDSERHRFLRVQFIIEFRRPYSYSLTNYMVPVEYMRSQRDPEDHGEVIFDEAKRGAVYVMHFHVLTYKATHAYFGYDLYLPIIGRDRNNIFWSEFCKAVAAVWSSLITSDLERAKLFFKLIASTDTHTSCVEVACVSNLSLDARTTLAQLYLDYFPDSIPLRYTESCNDQVKHVKVPDALYHAIVRVDGEWIPSYQDMLALGIESLGDIETEAIARVQTAFDGVVSIKVVQSDSMLRYYYHADENLIVINGSLADQVVEDQDRLTSLIVCFWLPHLKRVGDVPHFDYDRIFRQLRGNKIRISVGNGKKRKRDPSPDDSAEPAEPVEPPDHLPKPEGFEWIMSYIPTWSLIEKK